MPVEKPSKPIFGRTKERAILRDRISKKGVTVLAGRPRIGKTRLLHDLRDNLAGSDDYLVGYKMGTGGINELLLHSLSDLYARWLRSASFVKQGRALFKDRKEGFIARFGLGFANVVAPLFETVDPTGMSPEIVKAAFSTLARLDEDQRTGGLILEPVSYDQTLHLVQLLAELDEKPLILILDAFEQLGDDDKIRQEGSTVTSFLGEPDSWPNCHFLVGMRDNKPEHTAYTLARSWDRSSPLSQIVTVGTMDLDDGYERDALLDYSREHIPAAKMVDDKTILAELQNDPGTLEGWILGQPKDEETLKKQAKDARALAYEELHDWFVEIVREGESNKIDFLARLALMPEMGDEETWTVFKDIVQDSIPEFVVRDLQARHVLDPDAPFPSFGHTSRYETAKTWWQTEHLARPHARHSMEHLIKANFGMIPDLSVDSNLYFACLVIFTVREYAVLLDPGLRSAIHVSLLLIGPGASHLAPEGFSELLNVVNSRIPEAAPLIGAALYNTLMNASADGERDRRDRLLDELRNLRRTQPKVPFVAERLAAGLFGVGINAKAEGDPGRREELLDELRDLWHGNPNVPSILEHLAKSLFNRLADAKAENDLDSRDEILVEIRALQQSRSDVPAVAEALAKTLCNTLIDVKAEGDLLRGDELLDELRRFAVAHPEGIIVEHFVRGLARTLGNSIADGENDRSENLRNEIRILLSQYPELCERLGSGLMSVIDKLLNDR